MLAEHDIAVIVSRTQNMPLRTDDDYDIAFKQPSLLQQAGVRFAISAGSSWGTRNLPWHTGMAVAFGLSPEMALRSITLTPAEIIGVADDLGSLEVGKKATLFVSEGDVLDYLGHGVELMFIEGAAVDLNNKHKELYEKYRQKEYPVEATE